MCWGNSLCSFWACSDVFEKCVGAFLDRSRMVSRNLLEQNQHKEDNEHEMDMGGGGHQSDGMNN